MSRTVLSVLGAVLLLLLAWTTVRRRKPHDLNSGIEDRPDLAYTSVDVDAYYADAERHMKKQWKQILWPRLQSADLGSVVEIAAGWGRNTEKLLKHAKKLVATDINARSIEHVRTRFARHTAVAEGRAHFYVNNGTSLPMVADGSATLVYSWDAMVHFPDFVIASYVKEVARILSAGGTTFLHHSNLPRCAEPLPSKGHPEPDACGVDNHVVNPEARAVVSAGSRFVTMKDVVAHAAKEAGLEVAKQDVIPWAKVKGTYDRYMVHDCISILRKPK